MTLSSCKSTALQGICLHILGMPLLEKFSELILKRSKGSSLIQPQSGFDQKTVSASSLTVNLAWFHKTLPTKHTHTHTCLLKINIGYYWGTWTRLQILGWRLVILRYHSILPKMTYNSYKNILIADYSLYFLWKHKYVRIINTNLRRKWVIKRPKFTRFYNSTTVRSICDRAMNRRSDNRKEPKTGLEVWTS